MGVSLSTRIGVAIYRVAGRNPGGVAGRQACRYRRAGMQAGWLAGKQAMAGRQAGRVSGRQASR